ncbi:MAG TPA: serine/threonine-protein kinase [Chthoniobacteraceae bacterium]|nr:serine/threonine-protein kinase [Chthoniobacteraceae bacterium]
MPPEPQNEKPSVPSLPDDNSWLSQFYTPSKTTIQTEYTETAETGPESPAAQLSMMPAEKYTAGEELGTGAMKRVRRTTDKNAARDVAMAVLLDPEARSKKISRFVREARITAALEHPNIVPIYDIGADEAGKPYFTMKLLGGETLHSILQKLNEGNPDYRRRYPLNRLLQIFLSVCNAVGFAHSRGVIHLDLKPANIQVGDFGEVLVLDWGLAKVLQTDPEKYPHRLVLGEGLREIPKEGVVRGTPGFMGPEQARGEYASLNEQTDIFALGAVLYTILKCKPPSKGSTKTAPGAADGKKSDGAPGFKIPPALESVAMKAMARQPVNRYHNAAELAGDVQAFLDGYATKAQQAGALMLLWLLIKRHSVVTTLICLSLVVVFGTLTGAFIIKRHSEQLAVDALNRMRQEQDARRKLEEAQRELGKLAAPHVMVEAEHFLFDAHALDYDEALSKLEYEVTLDSENRAAWEDLGAPRRGRLEFDQAKAAFSHIGKVPENNNGRNATQPQDLPAVAWKYSLIVHENGGVLPREEEENFINDVYHAEHTAPPVHTMAVGAFFANQNRGQDTVNFELIERVLRQLNPAATNLEFGHTMTEDGLKISLHGGKVTQLLPLIGLPVAYLDFSNLPDLSPDNMAPVRNMPLVGADFSGSRFALIGPLSKIPTLRELRIINTHDKDYNFLRSMSQLKRIVVAKADLAEAKRALTEHTHTPPPEIIGE